MSRLAWFSPMPPARSGVAAVSADLVAGLAGEHEIDIFVDGRTSGSSTRVRPAHDFVWARRRTPYDLAVYQVGNSACHDYLYPYLFRFPGLAVLHDVRLHHARAAALLRRGLRHAYRDEFTWNHPHASPDLAEVAVAGFDNQLYYAWPMTRLIVQASRTVAVHTAAARDELCSVVRGADVQLVRLGHGVPLLDEAAGLAGARARARLGIATDSLVFGCYGGLAPEKRIPQVLAAFRATLRYTPGARLLLVGDAASHYDVHSDIEANGVAHQTIVAGYASSDEWLTDTIAACDVGLALRWPTAGEVSGPWLRCLAMGKATIVLDLAHLADVPSLDPRTWQPQGAAQDCPPVCVAVDLLDEDHSLRLAMRRLAADPALRNELGAEARAYWAREHSVGAMLGDYRHTIARALACPAPAPALPPHLTDDGSRVLRAVVEQFGLSSPVG